MQNNTLTQLTFITLEILDFKNINDLPLYQVCKYEDFKHLRGIKKTVLLETTDFEKAKKLKKTLQGAVSN